MQINILVEGDIDQELVAALLTNLGKVERWDKSYKSTTTSGNLIAVYKMGGWTTLPTHQLLPQLRQSLDVDVLNLVIFDADTTAHDRGGFIARRAELQRQADELELHFQLFLFPTDTADGNVEDLLEALTQLKHRPLLDCFRNYEICVSSHLSPSGVPYSLPGSKDKFYAYAQAMPLTPEERQAHKKQGSTKYFTNVDYWDLDADEAQALRQFLAQNVL